MLKVNYFTDFWLFSYNASLSLCTAVEHNKNIQKTNLNTLLVVIRINFLMRGFVIYVPSICIHVGVYFSS